MIDSFVVFSPARTGSSLISNSLNEYFKVKTYQTHNPLFLPENPSTSVAIISKRKDLFQLMISKITLDHTKEYSGYDKTKIVNPFLISEEDFTNCYVFLKSFYHLIDRDKFKDVKEVYFEDVINDPKYLLSLFNLDFPISLNSKKNNKSPYVYSDIVLNLDQCRTWFDQLEQTSITNDTINIVRRDILRVEDIDLWTGTIK